MIKGKRYGFTGLQVYVYLLIIKEENSGFTGLQVYIYAIIIKGKQSWFTCLQVYIYSIKRNNDFSAFFQYHRIVVKFYRFTGLQVYMHLLTKTYKRINFSNSSNCRYIKLQVYMQLSIKTYTFF